MIYKIPEIIFYGCPGGALAYNTVIILTTKYPGYLEIQLLATKVK